MKYTLAILSEQGDVQVVVEDIRRAMKPTEEEIEDLNNLNIIDPDELWEDILIIFDQMLEFEHEEMEGL